MNVRRLALCALCVVTACVTLPAAAWIRSPATNFAVLPPGTSHPEGLTADAQGNLYVADLFPDSDGNGTIVVFDHAGRLQRRLAVAPSSGSLLGLAFHPISGALLVLDFGAGNVLQVNPPSGAATVWGTVPQANAGLNALTFDTLGNVYVSDSFNATIWKFPMGGGTGTAWVHDSATLGTTGIPPFGANGVAFNNEHTALFVANTGNDTIVKIPVDASFNPGAPAVFVNSINGADGLIIDDADNIWVCANQADEIVVVDPTGKAIAKLGDFDGIDPRGVPQGLLFPASLVFSNGFLYVTNLGLDLRDAGVPALTVDTAWADQVKQWNVARIRAQIPPQH